MKWLKGKDQASLEGWLRVAKLILDRGDDPHERLICDRPCVKSRKRCYHFAIIAIKHIKGTEDLFGMLNIEVQQTKVYQQKSNSVPIGLFRHLCS